MIEFISRLPQGYQEVEYIESSGTQYIDTGFVVNKSDSYVLEIDGLFPSQAQAYQGCNGYMQFITSSKYGISGDSSVAVGNRNTVRVEYANQTEKLFVDGAQIESKSWSAYDGSDVKLALFRLGDINNGWFTGTIAQGTIYGYKVWKNNILVSECVPCVRNSDNVAGVYDIIREQFITNVGSGVFAVGADSNKHTIVTITPGGVISFGAALRRRMMSKKPAPQWTLTIENVASYASVSINGENLTAGSYVVDDGTIVSFVLRSTTPCAIYLDNAQVGTKSYDLEMHANYTAKFTNLAFILKWEITTQP